MEWSFLDFVWLAFLWDLFPFFRLKPEPCTLEVWDFFLQDWFTSLTLCTGFLKLSTRTCCTPIWFRIHAVGGFRSQSHRDSSFPVTKSKQKMFGLVWLQCGGRTAQLKIWAMYRLQYSFGWRFCCEFQKSFCYSRWLIWVFFTLTKFRGHWFKFLKNFFSFTSNGLSAKAIRVHSQRSISWSPI